MSSGPSAGTTPFCASASRRDSGEVMRASASGVSGGSRPFSGSVISEVRLVPTTDVLCSVQKLLYPPMLPPAGSGSVRTSLGAFSRSTRSRACRSSAATSSGLRNACSARFSGRSRGVMVPLFQIAWISGWPHGVRGAVQPASGAWACASPVAGARVTSASTVTNAAGSLTIRWVISTSSPVRRLPSRRPKSGSCRRMPRQPRPGSACRTAAPLQATVGRLPRDSVRGPAATGRRVAAGPSCE